MDEAEADDVNGESDAARVDASAPRNVVRIRPPPPPSGLTDLDQRAYVGAHLLRSLATQPGPLLRGQAARSH